GIEAESVEVIFLQPVQRVVNEEIAHRPAAWAVEVDRFSPGRAMAIREKFRRIGTQIISFRPEVVIDHVQKDHKVLRMRSIYQMLQFFWPSVATCRCIWQ